MKKYLIRLDDACPTMDHAKWRLMEEILDRYGVKPMVGVIPHNEDPRLMIDTEETGFWYEGGTLKRWIKKGWTIALHGYNHSYMSKSAGINPMWRKSEFAGLHLEVQKKKIQEGMKIFREYGIDPRYFFAPSHTYDENTLIALKEESNIRIISDTIATKPYRYKGFTFIPQQSGHCTNIPLDGIWTFCLHPPIMDNELFRQTEEFLKTNKDLFICFDELDLKQLREKDIFSKILSWTYFTYRKFRGFK